MIALASPNPGWAPVRHPMAPNRQTAARQATSSQYGLTGFEAAMKNADPAVGHLAKRLAMGLGAGSNLVVVAADSRRRWLRGPASQLLPLPVAAAI